MSIFIIFAVEMCYPRTSGETIVIRLYGYDRSCFIVSTGRLTGAKMKEKEDFELNPEEKEELVREIRDLYRILIPDTQIEEDR